MMIGDVPRKLLGLQPGSLDPLQTFLVKSPLIDSLNHDRLAALGADRDDRDRHTHSLAEELNIVPRSLGQAGPRGHFA